jgi:hypothetical protein
MKKGFLLVAALITALVVINACANKGEDDSMEKKQFMRIIKNPPMKS